MSNLDLTKTGNMKLVHKSRKYADKIMNNIHEEHIRAIIFQCWIDAYAQGYADGARTESEYPRSKDMVGG